MKKYIDADALLESLSVDPIECPGCPEPELLPELRALIEEAPSADVIPLGVEMWLDRFDIQTRHWRSEDGETVKVSFIINRKEQP